jgi:hypothetical protein
LVHQNIDERKKQTSAPQKGEYRYEAWLQIRKTKMGGLPTMYWRYIAALFMASVLIYLWKTFLVTRPPEQYTINYSQCMEQLGAVITYHLAEMLTNYAKSPAQKKRKEIRYSRALMDGILK